jgi:hypothetical protein
METTFLTGVSVVTGRRPHVVRLGTVIYLDLPFVNEHSPYIRLTHSTATNYTLALSSRESVFSTREVSSKGHPDAVAAALIGLVYRGIGSYNTADTNNAFVHALSTEWPPGRVTSFTLMLSLQTHTAVEVPFCRTAISPSHSVWTRGDGRRNITTTYKADHVEVMDSSWIPAVTKVVVYPHSLKFSDECGWSCSDQEAIGTLLRGLWKCLCE